MKLEDIKHILKKNWKYLLLAKVIKYLVVGAIILLSGKSLDAQMVMTRSTLDTNQILIGDHVNLSVEVVAPKSLKVNLPMFGDTVVENVEVLEASYVDTFNIDINNHRLIQRYLITSFDSGIYEIPRLPVELVNDSGVYDTAYTNPLMMAVFTIPVDTTKMAIFDIKKLYETPMTFDEIEKYVYWGIAILILITIGFYVIYKLSRNEPLIRRFEKPKEPAHIIAYRDLKKLKQEKLWQNNKIKEFHSSLSEIVRVYIENRYGVQAMEQTTDETIKATSFLLSKELQAKVSDMLSLADLVKFAKMSPLPDENDKCLKDAYELVDTTRLIIESSNPNKDNT